MINNKLVCGLDITPQGPFFTVLRSSIWRSPIEKKEWPSFIDWQPLIENFRNQEMLPLVSYTLLSLPQGYALSKEQRHDVLGAVAANIQLFEQVREVYTEVFDFLEGGGVKPILVKGCELANRYPEPCLRAVGDIDFFLFEEDARKGVKILTSNGVDYHGDTGRHHKFSFKGIEIELHHHLICANKDFREGINLKTEMFITNPLKDDYPHKQMLEKISLEARVLPKMSELIYNLAHLSKHLQKGIGLRQFVDMAIIIHDFSDDIDNETFQSIINISGLRRVWSLVAWFLDEYLGLELKTLTYKKPSVRRQRLLVSSIIKNGNFGQYGKGKNLSLFLLFPRYTSIKAINQFVTTLAGNLISVLNKNKI